MSTLESLKNIDEADVKEIYEMCLKYEKTSLLSVDGQKKLLDSMKKRMADLENLVNSKNEIDPKKVKAGILKKALVTFLEKVNKLQQELTVLESYLSHFNNNDIPKTQSLSYDSLVKEKKENDKEYKKYKKDKSGELSEEVINAISLLASQDAIKEIYPNAKSKEKTLKENEPELIQNHINLVNGIKAIIVK